MSNRNAVFFTVDATFLPFALATALALTEAEPSHPYDIVIMLRGGVDPALRVPDNVTILPNDAVDMVPAATDYSRPWGAIAYTRILAPLVLGDRYRRLLYLDADTACFGPVAPLFALDLKGLPLAAVEGMMDEYANLSEFDVSGYKRGLGITDGRAFNSGVLLIDTELWSKLDHPRSLDRYVREVQPNLELRIGLAGDQDYLNYALAGRWLTLSPIWNFQRIHMRLALEQVIQPSLVHYVGPVRPWAPAIYPFGRHHTEYYSRNLPRVGLTDARRYIPRSYYTRAIANIVRDFWYNQINVAAKRREFDHWRRARNAYRGAIGQRLDDGEYADIEQGLASIALSTDPFADISFEDVSCHRNHIWPRQ